MTLENGYNKKSALSQGAPNLNSLVMNSLTQNYKKAFELNNRAFRCGDTRGDKMKENINQYTEYQSDEHNPM
jgi:hypothetical protein